MTKDIFDQMVEQWPSAVVSRGEIERFTGGMISGKYLANLDSQKMGPERVKMGRKVGYPVNGLAAWLRERSK
ncbi:MAG: hypothetical protein H8D67_24800 [Deltaproteobacteria bacterium]|nr:hypothetical protein [Deltaproteobacteria bacterium]MBL7203688.1 hypothetical protein [Desulfobacteraceae bacterium]